MQMIINESGCRQLAADMLILMKQIAMRVSDIDSQNSTLHAALGEDAAPIAQSVKTMTSNLSDAQSELNVIIRDMQEYMAEIQQARIELG